MIEFVNALKEGADGFGPEFMATLDRYIHLLQTGHRKQFEDDELLFWLYIRLMQRQAEEAVKK